MESRLRVYSDGASRGNPGPSAIAFVILTEDGRVLRRHSRYVGVRTNNQAEYEALISALESASELTDREVVCFLDSELVVKHLTGRYRVRNSELKVLWVKVRDLEENFERVSFKHVSRAHYLIQEVDRLANETLDRVQER